MEQIHPVIQQGNPNANFTEALEKRSEDSPETLGFGVRAPRMPVPKFRPGFCVVEIFQTGAKVATIPLLKMWMWM